MTFSLELFQRADELVDSAAKPIEAPYNQRVTATQMREGGSQPSPVGAGARHTVLEHTVAAELCKGILLKVELLILRQKAGVADQNAGDGIRLGGRGRDAPFRAGSQVSFWQWHAGFATQFPHEFRGK
jgi:hypothetical protein